MVDIVWKGKAFFLTQFHFHSPSENLVDGKHFDMEAHFVHQAEDGQILVLAAMLDAQDDVPNPYLSEFWDGFPRNITTENAKEIDSPYANEKGLLPADQFYYFYNGSLTTPPCTIDTDWVVLASPVNISLAQRDSFRRGISNISANQLVVVNSTPDGVALPWDCSIGVDSRPIQPLGNRTVWSPPRKAIKPQRPGDLSGVIALAPARLILVMIICVTTVIVSPATK